MYIEFDVTIRKSQYDHTNYNDRIKKEFSIDLPDDMQTTLDIGGMANAVVSAAMEAYRKAQTGQKEPIVD